MCHSYLKCRTLLCLRFCCFSATATQSIHQTNNEDKITRGHKVSRPVCRMYVVVYMERPLHHTDPDCSRLLLAFLVNLLGISISKI
ncbi:hypothetical protein V1509DRAFT_625435 [Lipomyces kononenkoae]